MFKMQGLIIAFDCFFNLEKEELCFNGYFEANNIIKW